MYPVIVFIVVEICSWKQQNEPVFYGPDGQIITQEESQFLQESVGQIPDPEEYDDYGWVVICTLLELDQCVPVFSMLFFVEMWAVVERCT